MEKGLKKLSKLQELETYGEQGLKCYDLANYKKSIDLCSRLLNLTQKEIGKLAQEDPIVAEHLETQRLSEEDTMIFDGQFGKYVSEVRDHSDHTMNLWEAKPYHAETGVAVGAIKLMHMNSDMMKMYCETGKGKTKGRAELDVKKEVIKWEQGMIENGHYF